MKTIVEAALPNGADAQSAAARIRAVLPESDVVIDSSLHGRCATVATVDSGRHDRLMMTLGIGGILTGCTIGFWLIPLVPSREIMHLLILPLSGAFWGLGLALTGAMLLSDNLEHFWSGTEETIVGAAPEQQVFISVTVDSADAAASIQSILSDHEAAWMSQEQIADTAERTLFLQASPSPSLSLSKTA